MDKLVILVIILFSFLCCSFSWQCFLLPLWCADYLLVAHADGIGINPSQTAGKMFFFTWLLWTFAKTQFDGHPSAQKEFSNVLKRIIKLQDLNLCAVSLSAAMQCEHHHLNAFAQMEQADFIISPHKCWQHCVKGFRDVWQSADTMRQLCVSYSRVKSKHSLSLYGRAHNELRRAAPSSKEPTLK